MRPLGCHIRVGLESNGAFQVTEVLARTFQRAGVRDNDFCLFGQQVTANAEGRTVSSVARIGFERDAQNSYPLAGDRVERGAPLVVLEAMKMEHTINAPTDGIVGILPFGVGDMVTEGTELLTLETQEEVS